MPELKIGVKLRSLRQPFKAALQTAAGLGVVGVEIDARHEIRAEQMSQSAIREMRKLLDDLRLRVSAIHFPTRHGYGVTQNLDRRVEATRQAMQLAYSLGTGVVINQVGRVPEQSEGPVWDLMVDVLRDLGDYGQRVGATLCAETGSESAADLARLLKTLPAGALGVNLDPGNLVVNGHSPLEAVASLGSDIRHVRINDGVPDVGRGRGVEVEIGRGSVDFPALLGALEELGYRGYYSIERDSADDPVAEVRDAIEFLRAL